MEFDISGSLPLVLKTGLPGDFRLTLHTLALAFFSGSRIEIINPSSAESVSAFLKFAERIGAEIEISGGNIFLENHNFPAEIELTGDVPDEILHILISGLLPRTEKITLPFNSNRRKNSFGLFQKFLKKAGFESQIVSVDDKRAVFKGTGGKDYKSSESVFKTDNIWEFEIISSHFFSAAESVNIAYFPGRISHALKLLSAMGFAPSAPKNVDPRAVEIERRKARAAGKTISAVSMFDKTDSIPSIVIPGDISIASAIACVASIIQKSDIRIGNVLWEQSSRGFFDSIRRMKSDFTAIPSGAGKPFETAEITLKWCALEGKHFSAAQSASFMGEIPLLSVVASCHNGETAISDIKNAPGLGRDGFNVLSKGLEMLGARVGEYADGIVVDGGNEFRGNLLDSSGIGSIALAFTAAGLAAAGKTHIFGFPKDAYPVKDFLKIVGIK